MKKFRSEDFKFFEDRWEEYFDQSRPRIANSFFLRPLPNALVTFVTACRAAHTPSQANLRVADLLDEHFFSVVEKELSVNFQVMRAALQLSSRPVLGNGDTKPSNHASFLIYATLRVASYWLLAEGHAPHEGTYRPTALLRKAADRMFRYIERFEGSSPAEINQNRSGSAFFQAQTELLKRANVFGQQSDYFRTYLQKRLGLKLDNVITDLAATTIPAEFDLREWKMARDNLRMLIGDETEAKIHDYVRGLMFRAEHKKLETSCKTRSEVEFFLHVYEPPEAGPILAAAGRERMRVFMAEPDTFAARFNLREFVSVCDEHDVTDELNRVLELAKQHLDRPPAPPPMPARVVGRDGLRLIVNDRMT